MKYVRILSLGLMLAMGLVVIGGGTASATVLCKETGCGSIYGTGTTLKAEAASTIVLHPPIGSIECEQSVMAGKTSNTGSSTETVNASIETLSFSSCNASVTVLKKGTWEFHTDPNGSSGNSTMTWHNTEITVEYLGFHCIFGGPEHVDLGTVHGHTNRLTVDSEAPRTGGRSGMFCGSSAEFTGEYKFVTPSSLFTA